MIKKFSALILAGMIALPAAAMAGGGDMSPADLEKKINMLSQQLEMLKNQMSEMKAASMDDEAMAPVSAGTRVELSGDFRARVDAMKADSPSHYSAVAIAQGVYPFLQAQPALETIGSGFANIGAMLAGLGPIMGDLTTWKTNIAPMGITDAAQQEALYYMFTNAEVQGMLTAMAAMPTTAVTDSMKDMQSLVGFMENLSAGARASIFNNMGYAAAAQTDYSNDSMLTNRFRMNMRVKVKENIDFKGRLAMYKAWGMQNNPVDPVFGGPFLLSALSMDGNRTRQPADNTLVMDRAMVNWNNINDMPIWFSIGRRPTSGGPPSELRQGLDKRMATPTAYMDYPFDGLTIGYAYNDLFGSTGLPGRIRFCYGRGFEAGPYAENGKLMNDVDFAGISWDIFKTEDRFLTFQSFGAFNMFNVPDGVEFPNPMEFVGWLNGGTYNPMDPNANNILDRANLGNIYHTTAVYQAKHNDLNYFLSLGWSRTDPSGYDELGTGLLTSWGHPLEDKDGYSVYTGIRYDIDDKGLKLGLEYNYGSEDWIAFTPGHDDLYASKLAVRGHAAEAYLIWDVPAGDAIARYADAFVRLGYQHHWNDYTGGGFWLGEPVKISELASDPLYAQFYAPYESLDQVYMSFDVFF